MVSASSHPPTQALSLWCIFLLIAICLSLSPAWGSSMIYGFWAKCSFHHIFHFRATLKTLRRPIFSIIWGPAPFAPLQLCQNDARTYFALRPLMGAWIFQTGRVAGKLLWVARAGHREADELRAWPGSCWALNEPFIQCDIWGNGAKVLREVLIYLGRRRSCDCRLPSCQSNGKRKRWGLTSGICKL